MKGRIRNLVIMVILIMFSCSDNKMRVSTKNNFEIVKLPDGSIAYLNKNSFIEYDKSFAQRIINQNGEVFYDVVKGESPFYVKTEVGEIQVIGTKFNVKSNMDKLELEVDEGIVELKIDKFISKVKKGQKAFIIEGKNEIKIYKAEFKHKKWMQSINKEFRQLGKEFDKSYKQIEKQSNKSWKKVKKDMINK